MKATRAAEWVLLGAAVLGLLGCASHRTAPPPTESAQEPANVVLHLANESEARRSVDLVVYVDGKLAAQRRVASLATATGFRDREVIPLHLSPGAHTLRVVADGRATSTLVEVVVTTRTAYVSVEYWYDPGSPREAPVPEKVELTVQDHPFGFC